MQTEHQQQLSTEAPVESFKVFFHLVSQDQKDLETHLVDVQKSLTLEECSTILSDKLRKVINNPQYKLTPNSEALNQQFSISKIVQKDDADIFVFYEGIKPVIKEKEKELHFDSLTKYSFVDDKKHVKVYVPLEGIGQHPEDKIHSRFLDRSFEVKIFDFKGKNWIFAVPKTQCQILIKESKVLKKDDKLIIKLGKIAEADNWFSLYKTRCVGEKELD